MVTLKKNKIVEAFDADEVTLGAMATSFWPSMVELLGGIGLDFIWVDLEHGGCSPYDNDRIENFIRAAECSDTELLVRLPTGEPAMIRRVIDTGVRNVLIPRLKTAEEVQTAVEATRYRYQGEAGERGSGSARTNNWGENRDVAYEDESVCLGVMIENTEAVENLDEILSISELGFVRPGPGDLSVSVGHPVEPMHPAVEEQRRVIEEKANERGVPLSTGVGYFDDINEPVDRGYRMLTIGKDISIVRNVLTERYHEYRGNISG